MDTELRQWCNTCQAATISYICPGCHVTRCSGHERPCPALSCEYPKTRA